MERSLFLPTSQIYAIVAGATRLFVRTLAGDAVSLTDEGWLMTNRLGQVRFAVGDHVTVSCPLMDEALVLEVKRLAGAPITLAKLSHAVARECGYPDICDLWAIHAARFDGVASRHWGYCKRHLSQKDRADVFRSFIDTRPVDVWTAWGMDIKLTSVNLKAQQETAS